MNAAYLHISLVHIPIVLTPLSVVLLAVAHLRSSHTIARVALGILISAALFAVVAFLLGEEAEEIVEHIPGVIEDNIESHEESSSLSLGLVITSALIGLLSWLAIAKQFAIERLLLAATFICALLASASLFYTAHLGGMIRHSEISSDPSRS
jgi:uncharacterized membrane protein